MSMSRRVLFAHALLAGLINGLIGGRHAHAQSAETAQYAYDQQGRLTRATYANGVVVEYMYDNAGNRTQVVRSGAPSPPPPPGFNATIDLTTTTTGANLRQIADAAGYNGTQNANVVFEVESGVSITGVSGAGSSGGEPGDLMPGGSGGVAIDTGTWPTGSYTISLTLTVKSGGAVRGGGGGGGAGASSYFGTVPGSNGGAGGDAVYCRLPMTINVNAGGEVRGGGAGGKGGSGIGSGSFTAPSYGGGGGGGGQPNGGGGLGATGNAAGGNGANGGAGTTAAWGSGGVGGSANNQGQNGGDYAATRSGVLGGYAVRKNGHAVTVNNSGSITGTVG